MIGPGQGLAHIILPAGANRPVGITNTHASPNDFMGHHLRRMMEHQEPMKAVAIDGRCNEDGNMWLCCYRYGHDGIDGLWQDDS